MTDAPTLLFGVGATKAGTTWLYRYLHDHPDCHLRSVKELHFFDGIDLGASGWHGRELRARRRSLAASLDTADPERQANLARQIADIDEVLAFSPATEAALPRYLSYLTVGAAGRALVADVTPAYALLAAGRLRRMAALLPDVRFVYLMRDPVERLWSHVRMLAARTLKDGQALADRANDILTGVLNDGERDVSSRGDYKGALQRLQRAVPAGRLMVEFSERLFDADGTRRLCAFLGLGWKAPDARPVHAGIPAPLDAARHRAAVAMLRPQYDYVDRTFGPLPPAWQASLAGA